MALSFLYFCCVGAIESAYNNDVLQGVGADGIFGHAGSPVYD